MLVKNCINYIIIGAVLFSIPALVYSIKSKDRSVCKNLLIIDVTNIIYLFINIIILPIILGLDQGLEVLFTCLISFIAVIIYTISIIICTKKINKNNCIISKETKISFTTVVLIILPILLFIGSYLRECYLINNSDLIIESHYQNGFIVSETSWYAISEKFCKEVTINSFERLNNKKVEYFTYSIRINHDIIDNYQIESSDDRELKHIDSKIINSILFDALNNHDNLNKKFTNPDYKKDETIINKAYITYFVNSGYYHVTIGYNKSDYGATTVVNEMIYKDEKYVGELLIHGDIKSVAYIEK